MQDIRGWSFAVLVPIPYTDKSDRNCRIISEQKMYNLFKRAQPDSASIMAYFCHHLSDNYADLSDTYVVLSDTYVDLSDTYVDLSLIPSVEK